jgi:hypothetical protein
MWHVNKRLMPKRQNLSFKLSQIMIAKICTLLRKSLPKNVFRFAHFLILILFIKTFILFTNRALYKQLIAKYPQYKDKIIYDYKKSLFTNLEFPQDPVRRNNVF